MKATKTASQVLRKALPGRMQVQLNFYDRDRRVHRPVPAHTLTFDVSNSGEARRLFARLTELVNDGAWRDLDAGDRPDADSELADGPARAVAR